MILTAMSNIQLVLKMTLHWVVVECIWANRLLSKCQSASGYRVCIARATDAISAIQSTENLYDFTFDCSTERWAIQPRFEQNYHRLPAINMQPQLQQFEGKKKSWLVVLSSTSSSHTLSFSSIAFCSVAEKFNLLLAACCLLPIKPTLSFHVSFFIRVCRSHISFLSGCVCVGVWIRTTNVKQRNPIYI